MRWRRCWSTRILRQQYYRRWQKCWQKLRGCEKARAIVPMNAASAADWTEEYLGPILAIKVVDDLAVAVDHINQFGSGHTDIIVTENYSHSRAFIQAVDSASVGSTPRRNSPTGLNTFGAVEGHITDKLHARGPVGLEVIPEVCCLWQW